MIKMFYDLGFTPKAVLSTSNDTLGSIFGYVAKQFFRFFVDLRIHLKKPPKVQIKDKILLMDFSAFSFSLSYPFGFLGSILSKKLKMDFSSCVNVR